MTGHTGPVLAVAVAPDGTWLATAGLDGTVRIWDATTGGPGPLMRVDGALRGCACLTGGAGLVVVGDAGVYVFELRQPGSTVRG
jgi:WD40 repeat protein